MPSKAKSIKKPARAKPKTDYASPERLQKIFSALDQLFPKPAVARATT